MAQAQNTKSIRIGSGIFRKNGVHIGLFNNGTVEVEMETASVKFSNGETSPRTRAKSAKISFDLGEINLANFERFYNIGRLVENAGGSKQVTGEVLQESGTAKKGSRFELKKSNASAVTSVAIKNASQAVNQGDYSVTIQDGKSVVTLKKDVVLTGKLTAEYTVANPKKLSYIIDTAIRELVLEDLVFEQVNAEGKAFRFIIPKGYNTEKISMKIGDFEKLDEAMTVPITIEAFPTEDGTLFIFEDEQAL